MKLSLLFTKLPICFTRLTILYNSHQYFILVSCLVTVNDFANPLDFEITRVDCTMKLSLLFTKLPICFTRLTILYNSHQYFILVSCLVTVNDFANIYTTFIVNSNAFFLSFRLSDSSSWSFACALYNLQNNLFYAKCPFPQGLQNIGHKLIFLVTGTLTPVWSLSCLRRLQVILSHDLTWPLMDYYYSFQNWLDFQHLATF